ncbi:pro-adrenomedullin [Pelobates fuscus]|uniref:pro-adrenomedullin n=1 Tax=Pelobates fuscus TaxID=191477 RepID=UPI002FE447A9
MELTHIILLHLSYLAVLGSAAAIMELRKDQKMWGLIEQHRIRRDLLSDTQNSAQLTDETSQSALIKPEDIMDPLVPSSSNAAHIRVKRYRHSSNHFNNVHSLRVGCRFGTCTIQNLAHQIYQYTDKDKDSTAPARKISSQGYGRRRRSVPDNRLLLTLVDGKLTPSWVRTSQTSRPDQERDTWRKGKLWGALLST